MKFKIGQEVLIESIGIYKKIIDCEEICNVEIYYMEDNTSYALSQIKFAKNIKIDLTLSFFEKGEKIKNLIDVEKIGKDFSEWYLRKKSQ